MSAKRKGIQILIAICAPIVLYVQVTKVLFYVKPNSFKLPTPVANGPTKTTSTSNTCQDQNITIVPWNDYWKWPDFGIGQGNEGFVKHQCSCTNCYLTLNKSHVEKADLLLIHGNDLGTIKHESLKELRKKHTDRTGFPMTIFFIKEPPE